MNDIALVTGAGTGLGQYIASHLVSLGYRVAFADYDKAAACAALAACDIPDDRGLALAVDIRDKASFRQALTTASAHFGGLHVLVNNAALTRTTPLMEISVEEFDAVINTNLRGTFLGCQLAGQQFSRQGYGRIINLASLAGQNGGSGTGAHYAASKGGIITLTKVFARDLAGHGVTVNAVAPGPLDLPSVHTALSAKQLTTLIARIPVAQLGEASFVAEAVALLASRQASFATGATWDINGGLNLR